MNHTLGEFVLTLFGTSITDTPLAFTASNHIGFATFAVRSDHHDGFLLLHPSVAKEDQSSSATPVAQITNSGDFMLISFGATTKHKLHDPDVHRLSDSHFTMGRRTFLFFGTDMEA